MYGFPPAGAASNSTLQQQQYLVPIMTQQMANSRGGHTATPPAAAATAVMPDGRSYVIMYNNNNAGGGGSAMMGVDQGHYGSPLGLHPHQHPHIMGGSGGGMMMAAAAAGGGAEQPQFYYVTGGSGGELSQHSTPASPLISLDVCSSGNHHSGSGNNYAAHHPVELAHASSMSPQTFLVPVYLPAPPPPPPGNSNNNNNNNFVRTTSSSRSSNASSAPNANFRNNSGYHQHNSNNNGGGGAAARHIAGGGSGHNNFGYVLNPSLPSYAATTATPNNSIGSYHSSVTGMQNRSSANSSSCNNNNIAKFNNAPLEEGKPFHVDPTPIDTTKWQLIVNFLPQRLTNEDFRALFRPYGALYEKASHIIYDFRHPKLSRVPVPGSDGSQFQVVQTLRSKGYGFVYFRDGQSTERAIKELNGIDVMGRKIKVRYADQQRSLAEVLQVEADEFEQSQGGNSGTNINSGSGSGVYGVFNNYFAGSGTDLGVCEEKEDEDKKQQQQQQAQAQAQAPFSESGHDRSSRTTTTTCSSAAESSASTTPDRHVFAAVIEDDEEAALEDECGPILHFHEGLACLEEEEEEE